MGSQICPTIEPDTSVFVCLCARVYCFQKWEKNNPHPLSLYIFFSFPFLILYIIFYFLSLYISVANYVNVCTFQQSILPDWSNIRHNLPPSLQHCGDWQCFKSPGYWYSLTRNLWCLWRGEASEWKHFTVCPPFSPSLGCIILHSHRVWPSENSNSSPIWSSSHCKQQQQ